MKIKTISILSCIILTTSVLFGAISVTADKIDDFSLREGISVFEAMGRADEIPGLTDSAKKTIKRVYDFFKELSDKKNERSIVDTVKRIKAGLSVFLIYSSNAHPVYYFLA